ncbi:hypothetical protein RISK_004179 [Rhodopirellula islandica]|uniref:Uncharacterized protein n=1 Tax=Rhodopirellula islandica TaxID=595434 RepID=A0A0J1BAQ4_RHOIS|nr:hypothetical protein [Rhodopirellula islandica]KLU03772.1 hypothetical protein RISK_004179 [Rhodopirellula islandica]
MTGYESNVSSFSQLGFSMKKYFCLFGLTLMLFTTTGCDSSTSELVTPDEDFYAKGLEAEKNGVPPGSSPGAGGSVKPGSGPSAISP